MNGVNRADGPAGERRASTLLEIALCFGMQKTSLAEDNAKVDLKIPFMHAFESGSLVTFHCQVKSGRSWKADSSTDKIIKLKIDSDTVCALSNWPSIIAWVPPSPDESVYWYAIDPRSKNKTPLQVPIHQVISPSLRFDLSRTSTYSFWSNATPKYDVALRDDNDVLSIAKKAYKKLCQVKHKHPLFGEVAVSRLAWRHVTKRSRTKSHRILSLRVVPYLEKYLRICPDRFRLSEVHLREEGEMVFETRYILCWYRSAFKIGKITHVLIIRIKEEVVYPKKWQQLPLGIKDILQKATLASWWIKREK